MTHSTKNNEPVILYDMMLYNGVWVVARCRAMNEVDARHQYYMKRVKGERVDVTSGRS